MTAITPATYSEAIIDQPNVVDRWMMPVQVRVEAAMTCQPISHNLFALGVKPRR